MTSKTLFEKHIEIFRSDIGMYYCGKRIASKNHSYGPEIRTHFLIVLVEDGNAVLYLEDRKIPLKNGDMLIMFPNEKIYYKTQTDWTIKWIGISGTQLEDIFNSIGVTRKNPVFSPHKYDEILNVMTDIYDFSINTSLHTKFKVQSLLYDFFALLLEKSDKKSHTDPICAALEIIKYNFNNELNIKSISDSLFLDCSYFSRLFKKKVGISPKKYILQIRLEKAKELLCKTNYPIKDIAVTVGFNDPLYFSKIFFRLEGISPSDYRNKTKA